MRPAGSPPPAPGARGPFLAFATAAALLLGGTAALGLYGRAHDAALQVGVVGLTAAALVASVLRARQPGPEALGWQIFSLSLLSNTLIQATRIPIFLGHPLPSYLPAISMVLQILGSLFLVGTLITWHLAPKTRFDRIRHGLDGLLFALAVFFILWGSVLGPVFLSDRFPILDRSIWLGTFLVYDLLLGMAVFFGLTEPSRFRGPLGWLALAFLLAGLHNFKWLLDVLSGHPLFHFPAGPFIFAIPLGYLAAALSPHPVGRASRPERSTRVVHLLPYIPVLGATALGVWLLATGAGPRHRLVLVWLALGLVLVLLVRQYLALRDFLALSQHLEFRVAERTQALEKAQSLLLRTERMNTMATLGAGLAHDMNNLLSAIQSRAELVILDLDDGRLPARQDMVRVQEAARTVASLGGRLMALGRHESETPRALDLVEELHALVPLLQVLLPRNQTLRLDAPPGPIPFLGTRGLLEQILVNLVSNARDAMLDGGSITLRARAAEPGEEPRGPRLDIEDTGTGIPEGLRDQVFQPFFTTKASGSGTGLGLVSVKSLLDKAGGAIAFASRTGQGTVFQVRLPRLPDPA